MIKSNSGIFGFMVICIFLFNSCCWDEPYPDIIVDETGKNIELNLNLLNCEKMGFEFILRSQADFDSLRLYLSKKKNCKFYPNQDQVSIDFNNYSVIGKNVYFKGCNPFFIREVLFDFETKKVDYNIQAGNCGLCNSSTVGSDNAILVRKIPDDFVVNFNVSN